MEKPAYYLRAKYAFIQVPKELLGMKRYKNGYKGGKF